MRVDEWINNDPNAVYSRTLHSPVNGGDPARITIGSPARLQGQFGGGARGLAPTGRSLAVRPPAYSSSSQPFITFQEQRGLFTPEGQSLPFFYYNLNGSVKGAVDPQA